MFVNPGYGKRVVLGRLEDPFFDRVGDLYSAAQEIRGICAFSTRGMTAIVSPVVLGPIIATTLSSLMSREAPERPW